MRFWAKTIKDGQKQSEAIVALPVKKVTELGEALISDALSRLAHELDLERPVLVGKHKRDLFTFSRAVFFPQDFIESVDFDRMTVEIIPDE